MNLKQKLRQQLLNQRQEMEPRAWRRQSDAICEHLRASAVVQTAKTILAYTSFRQEPDLQPLLMAIAREHHPMNDADHGGDESGDESNDRENDRDQDEGNSVSPQQRIIGLPRCEEKSLIWHHYNPLQSADLQVGAYGILAPGPDWPRIQLRHLDPQVVVLVPAVGCDRRGYRLGYGGGFYDRMLSQPHWTSITTIGIVFSFAYLDKVPIDRWDQPLSGICTERGLTLIRR